MMQSGAVCHHQKPSNSNKVVINSYKHFKLDHNWVYEPWCFTLTWNGQTVLRFGCKYQCVGQTAKEVKEQKDITPQYRLCHVSCTNIKQNSVPHRIWDQSSPTYIFSFPHFLHLLFCAVCDNGHLFLLRPILWRQSTRTSTSWCCFMHAGKDSDLTFELTAFYLRMSVSE